jgi:hypothetical protein
MLRTACFVSGLALATAFSGEALAQTDPADIGMDEGGGLLREQASVRHQA